MNKEKTSLHFVTVYRMKNFHKLFSISCINCKLQDQCAPVKHKRENCAVANSVENVLGEIVSAHVSGFINNEFYVNNDFRFNIVRQLLKQYRMPLDNVR